MKKILLAIVLVIMMLVAVGCTQAQPDAEALWTVTIIGENDEAIEFTDIDAESLTTVVVETNRTDRDGNALDQTWTGVTLKDVLEAKGLEGYTGCTVEASDGYSKDYTREIMDGDGTIIAWLLDGEAVVEDDGGPVQMIPKGEANNMYIKNLSKIITIFE